MVAVAVARSEIGGELCAARSRARARRCNGPAKVPSIGTGSMEITESEPSRHIDLAVNFNGLDGTSSYDISPAGSGSKVTWAFGYDSGTSPLKRWKALMLDGFVGAEYRAGLDRLKEKIESERRPTAPTISETPRPAACRLKPSSLPRRFRLAPCPARRSRAARCCRGAWPAWLRPQAAPAAGGADRIAAAPAAAEATTPAPAPAPTPPEEEEAPAISKARRVAI